MADSVKIKLELGDVELAYEGPAAFAKTELAELVGGLIDKLASVRVEMDDFEDFDLEAEDDDADEPVAVPEGAKGH